VYPLLAAKQAEMDAERESIEALRDYWIAHAELERATASAIPYGNRHSTLAPTP
jgi:outer membrane protein TolC